MIKTISYLGLGTMGGRMAANLLKAGYQLTVCNRNEENANRLLERVRAAPVLRRTPSATLNLSCIEAGGKPDRCVGNGSAGGRTGARAKSWA